METTSPDREKFGAGCKQHSKARPENGHNWLCAAGRGLLFWFLACGARRRRMDSSVPQRFAGIDIPDSRDARLVQQEILQRAPANLESNSLEIGSV